MTKDTEILKSMFSSYLASGSNPPTYGMEVVSLDGGKKLISAELTFKENETYCCSEATCHFKPNWARIREIAEGKGLALSTPLSIELSVIVEAGAKIKTNASIGLPLKAKSQQYVEKFSE